MKRVLIIEDDADFLRSVSAVLETQYQPFPCQSAREGIQLAFREKPDLILVDLDLPEMSGFEVCQRLRESPSTRDIPIVFLSGDAKTDSKVKGLELGADDYIAKPVESRELLARIGARLRKPARDSRATDGVLSVGNLKLNLKSSEVSIDGEPRNLTQVEIRLLQYFVEHANEMISRTQLLGDLWPDAVVAERTVDTHVAHLRKKLSGFNGAIKTIFRAGYRFESPLGTGSFN